MQDPEVLGGQTLVSFAMTFRIEGVNRRSEMELKMPLENN
jgi:hypothetical protein